MKNILLPMMLAITFSMPAFAADAKTEKNSAQASKEEQNFDDRIAQMQGQMAVMHAQMDQIRQTSDPKERQKLIQEHWDTMQKARGMMDGMWGPGRMGGPGGPMMGGGMMGGRGGPMMGGRGGPMMWNDYRHMSPEQMKQRQYMMYQYMGMQQQMMDQMMEHQGYMWQH